MKEILRKIRGVKEMKENLIGIKENIREEVRE